MYLSDEAATLALGAAVAGVITKPFRIWLEGDLGAGKTTFTRGLLRALNYDGNVKSPTFTLVEPYDLPWGQVFHFDLYRLNDPDELEYIGIDDYLSGENLCLVEWPLRAGGILPPADLHLTLRVSGTAREATLAAETPRGEAALKQLS